MLMTAISPSQVRRFCLLLLSVPVLFLNNARLVQAQGPDVASTNRQGEWNRYRLKEGEFSVLLPAPPALSSYEGGGRLGPQEDRLRHLIGAYYQGCGYVISVYETRKSLDDFSNWFLSGSNAEFKGNLKAAGMSGKEFAYTDASAKGITKFLVSKERTYVFKAEASSLGNPDIDFAKFFESISFGRPIAGNVIYEGPSSVQSLYSPSVTKESDSSIFTGREVTQKVRVLSKPEPSYTEEARQAQITGTVVLRSVFSDTGEVIKIRAVSELPHGLTERAIGAARQIKFIPAIKDGRFVSTYIQLEYNFNLY